MTSFRSNKKKTKKNVYDGLVISRPAGALPSVPSVPPC